MFGVHVNSQQTWVQIQSPINISNYKNCNYYSKPRTCSSVQQLDKTLSSTFALSHFTVQQNSRNQKTHFYAKASSASSEYTEEPATKVAFRTNLNLPGCSTPLSLLGTGVREKVFAIVGVKVYAAGLYANPSLVTKLESWRGRSTAEIQGDSTLFASIFQVPLEKSLQIVFVRDVDGKTFWDALDDAVSPRIKSLSPLDESALSTFRSIFQDRTLKKGNFVFLTWINPSKMLVSVSSDGLPTSVDAEIESGNVTSSLFDVYFGGAPVSLSLKASVANGLATILK